MTIRQALLIVVSLSLCLVARSGRCESPAEVVSVISELDAPSLFAYLSWEGKAKVENGTAIIREANNQGGAGFNSHDQPLALQAFSDTTPAIRVRTGAANEMKSVNLMLADSSEVKGTWQFLLSSPSFDWIWLTAVDGTPLSTPNVRDDKNPEPLKLDKIVQWQLIGDWAGGVAVDLEIDQIALVKPSEMVLASRKVLAEKMRAEANAKKAEQDALTAQYSKRTDLSPQVKHVCLVAPDILSLTIQAGVRFVLAWYRWQLDSTDVAAVHHH